ncbi:peptide chain release factor N(5)-glutamine methyltransferase [Vibrio agarivorans]|uniref:peptide chain release factor N(5)-glutamine methyltransferase n=1 Tax=Vibrio agarivorans TaxID=153622 RepID=UPI0025B52F14|nr:peptide chain release factor N(5)-glutamine methyltransferase [Vibrio agarivorans]MDN3662768.1 peptide chain release factor N(5)-glutamine methyltransferase [Vibrio agarivorans]
MSTQRIDTTLRAITARLVESGSESPSLDASLLLCHILDKPRSYLLTWPEKALSEQELSQLELFVIRREKGEPMAYILGFREFWSLNLKVATSTLIPRPDTERLVELALDKAMDQEGDILDLGTGTGAIALALASELPKRQVFGVDFQQSAFELASENRDRLQLHNAQFMQGSWYEPIQPGAKFAVITSNPPYIDAADPHLDQGDVRFEPKTALVADDNGLADIRYITEHARQYLATGGWLLLEHGYQQGEAVREILVEFGFDSVSTEKDFGDNDRVTLGQWNIKE